MADATHRESSLIARATPRRASSEGPALDCRPSTFLVELAATTLGVDALAPLAQVVRGEPEAGFEPAT